MTEEQVRFLDRARVGHLATVDARNHPHVVPVVFAVDGDDLLVPLDAKPKRVPARKLGRVRNVEVNPHVALVVDLYDEHWERLRWLMIRGRATVEDVSERARALLLARYPQYEQVGLEGVIRVVAESVVEWRALPPALP